MLWAQQELEKRLLLDMLGYTAVLMSEYFYEFTSSPILTRQMATFSLSASYGSPCSLLRACFYGSTIPICASISYRELGEKSAVIVMMASSKKFT